jgi:hypothetical protein
MQKNKMSYETYEEGLTPDFQYLSSRKKQRYLLENEWDGGQIRYHRRGWCRDLSQGFMRLCSCMAFNCLVWQHCQ